MELKITSEKDMPQLDRKEVKAEIEYEGMTPSRKDIRKELASAAGSDEELTIIRKIKPGFGNTKGVVTARVYNDADSMKSIEGRYMVERHAGPESEEGAGDDQEEASEEGEESSAEEKKDEAEEGKEESAEDESEDEDKGE